MQEATSSKNWYINIAFLFCCCLPIKSLAEPPRLSQQEVVNISNAEITKRKIDLSKYYSPQILPPRAPKKEMPLNDSWLVLYKGIEAKPGAHFGIYVNDKTRAVIFFPGQ